MLDWDFQKLEIYLEYLLHISDASFMQSNNWRVESNQLN